tara:strand:- start:307 stop:1047 length:741 start_codon:yes stop_codon:yes gene_type:complete
MKILVIGESNKDIFHYGESVRLCPDAPVPVFKSLKMVQNGGMAKNVEANLSSFGIDVDIITNRNWKKVSKTRFVDLRSNHMFLRVDENDTSYGTLSARRVEGTRFEDYTAIVVSDYNKGFLAEDILQKISLSHPLVFLDTKKVLGPWAENFTYIKINNKEYEATQHTMTEKLKNNTIITRGPNGSEFRKEFYPVPAVEIKDTSGAGDTFLSGLCYKYVLTGDICLSIKFANICATTVVQKRGVGVP